MMHLGGRSRRSLPMNAEINITNLVDVAFVLLIIFMITAPILQGGIEVQLPEANARPIENADAIVVSIASDGSLFIGKAKVEEAEFETVLQTYLNGDERPFVQVKSDRGVSWGRVAEVLGYLVDLEVDVGFAVEPKRN